MTPPLHAIEYCLIEAKIEKEEIGMVVFYDNPLYPLDRLLENVLYADGDTRDIIDRSFDMMFAKKYGSCTEVFIQIWRYQWGELLAAL